MYAHIDTYNQYRLQTESKRVSRVLSGTEGVEARARNKRLGMAQMGLSSTNLVFDSSLASQYLDPEILDILKDDPEKDSGIMHTRVPVEQVESNGVKVSLNQLHCLTSGIAESDTTGGYKSLQTDSDDDEFEHVAFYDRQELAELDHIASGSLRVIDRLPFFIHDLKRWSNGFNPIKFKRAESLQHKAFRASYMPAEQITKRGKVSTRRMRQPRRVPRKRSHSTGLQAK